MIRALLNMQDGRQMVLLGLDKGNLERMINDQPIKVNLRNLDPSPGADPTELPDIDVAICWIPDREALEQLLRSLPHTEG